MKRGKVGRRERERAFSLLAFLEQNKTKINQFVCNEPHVIGQYWSQNQLVLELLCTNTIYKVSKLNYYFRCCSFCICLFFSNWKAFQMDFRDKSLLRHSDYSHSLIKKPPSCDCSQYSYSFQIARCVLFLAFNLIANKTAGGIFEEEEEENENEIKKNTIIWLPDAD